MWDNHWNNANFDTDLFQKMKAIIVSVPDYHRTRVHTLRRWTAEGEMILRDAVWQCLSAASHTMVERRRRFKLSRTAVLFSLADTQALKFNANLRLGGWFWTPGHTRYPRCPEREI